MKKIRFLSNQNGSMTLLLVFVVVTVAAILVLKASSSFDAVNKLHSRQRTKVNLSPQMHRLAQMVKQSFIAAQINPACTHTGKPGDFKAQKINGSDFCVPKKSGFCVEVPQGNETRQFCISTKTESLQWKTALGLKEIEKQETPSEKKVGELHRSNRIIIPATTDSNWRSCSGSNLCVRLLLCPEGKTDCDEKDSIASQIVRIGGLE